LLNLKVEAAREIATAIAHSPNRVFLNSDQLLVNLTSDFTLKGKSPGQKVEGQA